MVGVHWRTLGKVEKGQRVSRDTLIAIERTLGWSPGSARKILNGGEPVYADAAARSVMAELPEKVRRTLAMVSPDVRDAFVRAYESLN